MFTKRSLYSSPPYRLELGDRDCEAVCEHTLLPDDHGLAIGPDFGSNPSSPINVVTNRLTVEGRDFLAVADESCWRTAMVIIKEKGSAVSMGVLIKILSALLRQSFGL